MNKIKSVVILCPASAKESNSMTSVVLIISYSRAGLHCTMTWVFNRIGLWIVMKSATDGRAGSLLRGPHRVAHRPSRRRPAAALAPSQSLRTHPHPPQRCNTRQQQHERPQGTRLEANTFIFINLVLICLNKFLLCKISITKTLNRSVKACLNLERIHNNRTFKNVRQLLLSSVNNPSPAPPSRSTQFDKIWHVHSLNNAYPFSSLSH